MLTSEEKKKEIRPTSPAVLTKESEFRLFVFDLDGTICDTLEALSQSGNQMLRRLSLPEAPREMYRHFVGNGARLLTARALSYALGRRAGEEEIAAAYPLYLESFREHFLDGVAMYPGMRALLFRLHAEGKRLACLTNKPQELAEQTLVHLLGEESRRLFRAIVGARGSAALKPDPEGLLNLLRNEGLTREEVLMIGDSDADILCARRAGTASCGCIWGFRGETELREAGATFLVRHSREIAQLRPLQTR